MAVEGDGKAVHLILDALEEEKFLRIARQVHHFQRISKEQFMGLVLIILLQTCNWNIQAQFLLDNLLSDIDLTLPPINHNQIWRSQSLTLYSTIASANDLSHAGIVVWSNNRFYLVLTVILLTRFTVDKDHHSRNRTSSHDVGVIEGLDANWGWDLKQAS
ncbi:Uncharacterised protein [Streptococcus pneumoniae]|nr:Uncharacterised protein [Streptococcus pneumoniae]